MVLYKLPQGTIYLGPIPFINWSLDFMSALSYRPPLDSNRTGKAKQRTDTRRQQPGNKRGTFSWIPAVRKLSYHFYFLPQLPNFFPFTESLYLISCTSSWITQCVNTFNSTFITLKQPSLIINLNIQENWLRTISLEYGLNTTGDLVQLHLFEHSHLSTIWPTVCRWIIKHLRKSQSIYYFIW